MVSNKTLTILESSLILQTILRIRVLMNPPMSPQLIPPQKSPSTPLNLTKKVLNP